MDEKSSANDIYAKLVELDAMIKEHLVKYSDLSLDRNYYYLSYIFK